MSNRDFTDGEDGMPSLLSLALFAAVFFPAIAVAEFGPELIEPVRALLAALPDSLKAAGLAVFILGAMAIGRLFVLLTGRGSGE